ncbi:Rid family hydrolase [Halomonas sp. GXIMD04776]|uniref:Rid family hydrolase n=1 Tax=Halomonas sp. GXIMD04776 TaxID=3415605 RepID=UPI003C8D60E5
MSINYLGASQRMSQVVMHNDLVYLSSQVPSDPGADMQGQTQQVLEAIDERLANPAWKIEIMVVAALKGA